ncbi:MAG: NAD-dependent epimerase/dehydratase family protein [Paracoccaceae bacterium]
MKIAVTGGSGGVGRGIVAEALARGHQVVSVDRVLPDKDAEQDGLVFIQVDITDYNQLLAAFAGCDALIHMAAIPNPMHDPDHVVHNNNVVGSYNAMRAAIELGITRICQASSVNAIGFSFSREPCHEYFPLDEEHPNHNEDSYALSKWISEQQADSLARRYEDIHIASMRFPLVVTDRDAPDRNFDRQNKPPSRHLWSYVLNASAARACLQSLDADFKGHEVFYICAPVTTSARPSLALAAKFFPGIPIKEDLTGHRSFISSAKAEKMLNWQHDLPQDL